MKLEDHTGTKILKGNIGIASVQWFPRTRNVQLKVLKGKSGIT
jgi:hypothetical protein